MHNPNQLDKLIPNRRLWIYPTFAEMPVQLHRGPLLTEYLKSIHDFVSNGVSDKPRCFAVRFDLRLPDHFDCADTTVITRFFKALDYELDVADLAKWHDGKRVHPRKLEYLWVREWSAEGGEILKPHYHVVLLLNYDRYRVLGSFDAVEGNLSARIKQAWSAAINEPFENAQGLVFFPREGQYTLKSQEPGYHDQVSALFHRLSYFAKVASKQFLPGQRNLGMRRSHRV